MHGFDYGLSALVLIGVGLVAFWIGSVVTSYRSAPPTQATIVRQYAVQLTRTVAIAVFTVLLLGAACFYVLRWNFDRLTCAQLVIVGLLSGAVGYAELISRYRDDPRRLLAAQATALYIAANISAAIAALALVKLFDVFGGEAQRAHRTLYEVLLASFGAIAFFRTSLFTARIGGADVGIGPSALLKSLLDASDLMINRGQAVARADEVKPIMDGVDFDKAKITLPTLCMTLVEYFPDDQKQELARQIEKLDSDASIVAGAKATILGGYLIRQFGAVVLARAVANLGPLIK